jgi:single-strand DNA-binding protein
MSLTTSVIVAGNLTRDPEVRYTKSGKAVASLTVASTPRVYDSATKHWEDGETVFLQASVWGDMAENVGSSLTKGSRVLLSGWFKSRSYTTKEGESRNAMELQVDDIGPSLMFATAEPRRRGRDAVKPAAASGDADSWANPGTDSDDLPF